MTKAPEGLKAEGVRLWKATCDAFELDQHELDLLELACRSLDTAARLAAELERAEVVVVGSKGQPRPNPLLAELRAERLTFARLLAMLRIPLGAPDVGSDRHGGPKLQRRGGARGVYQFPRAVS